MEPLIGMAVNNPCALSEHWTKACTVWVETIQKLCSNFDYSDAPWEYLERTNTALFAGALSASGLPSMPETYVMREGQSEQKEQRVDICSVDAGKSIELIEMKMAEYDPVYQQTVQYVDTKARQATTQVNSITGLHGNELHGSDFHIKRTIGIIGLPYFQPGIDRNALEDAIQLLIHDLRNSPYAVKAWVFPPEYISAPGKRYGKYYPGTFFVARPAC